MPRKGEVGNFRSRKTESKYITICDFTNPWNFFQLFIVGTQLGILEWLQYNGLIGDDLPCWRESCGGSLKLRKKSCIDGYAFRCRKDKNHEFSLRKGTIFDKSHYLVADIMVFIKVNIFLCTITQKHC
ncbi:unnamed protein product [Owenia fusiformis]|uniref:Uncharacterized protein n=1 Tax=Owenia fusiformis TaxID=6347 RepID=A0A8S4PNP9_OWEFU|nr:unnamed protein product [Owenia fusiformis]